jgi:glycosyltransferase involved in cell wall biosynthesis
MTSRGPSTYAIITPARDEAENLRRLGECLLEQSIRPAAWVVVDNGSTDGTVDVVRGFARSVDWILLASSPPADVAQPGEPIVRAFHTGLSELDPVDVVVKLDADVSIARDYFERLLTTFASHPSLGIASGQCLELVGGEWRPTYVTGSHVRGAARAWRWDCLQAVLPLDDTVPCVMDLVDELKAASLGWRTGIVPELSFYHHRKVGERDGGTTVRWARQGRAAYYVGYRFWYLAARAGFRAIRHPAALAMIRGYLGAAVRREARCTDRAVVDQLRQRQSIWRFPRRVSEAMGRHPKSLTTT